MQRAIRSCRSLRLRAPALRRTVPASTARTIRPRVGLICRADAGGAKPQKDEEIDPKDVQEFADVLKEGGMDSKMAAEIVTRWKSLGAEADPDALRKLFLQQSLVPLAAILLQTLLDTGASYFSYITGETFSQDPAWWSRVVSAGCFVIAGYFALGVVFDLFTLGVVAVSAVRFGTNTTLFYEAVKSLAGTSSGLNVADKATNTVNSLRVLQTLNSIADLLRVTSTPSVASTGSVDTLKDLSTYLTLYNAEKKFGFKAEKYGVSQEKAVKIAGLFGKYDSDDDGKLTLSDFTRLCADADVEVSSSDVKATLELLDTNKDGFVEFDELVDWFVNRQEQVASDLKQAGNKQEVGAGSSGSSS